MDIAIASQRLGAIQLELEREVARKKEPGHLPISEQIVDQVQQLVKFTENQFTPEQLAAMKHETGSTVNNKVGLVKRFQSGNWRCVIYLQRGFFPSLSRPTWHGHPSFTWLQSFIVACPTEFWPVSSLIRIKKCSGMHAIDFICSCCNFRKLHYTLVHKT